jgi:hypothetical protein
MYLTEVVFSRSMRGRGRGLENVFAKKDLRNRLLLPGDLNIPDIELVIEGSAR